MEFVKKEYYLEEEGGDIKMAIQTGYCMKCKKQQPMKNITKKILGGRMQVKGQCKVCGTNMSVFIKK